MSLCFCGNPSQHRAIPGTARSVCPRTPTGDNVPLHIREHRAHNQLVSEIEGMLRERYDAAVEWQPFLAMWQRIGHDYAIGWLLSLALRMPMRDGSCALGTHRARHLARETLRSYGLATPADDNWKEWRMPCPCGCSMWTSFPGVQSCGCCSEAVASAHWDYLYGACSGCAWSQSLSDGELCEHGEDYEPERNARANVRAYVTGVRP